MTKPNEEFEEDFKSYLEEFMRDPDALLGVSGEKLSKSFRYNGRLTKLDHKVLFSKFEEQLIIELKTGSTTRTYKKLAVTPKKASKKAAAPPRLAEYCILFLAPKNTAQALLGDLQEMFQANIRRLGEKEARRIYRMQALASAWPLVWTWIKRILLSTAFVDYVRSKLGF